ncbi:MAG: hypothetical protein WEB37_11040 [Bacteroidota bacterium]
MKRATSNMKTSETRPIMVWSITDEVIEDRNILEKQFHDLADAGFGGVAAYVRCSRYSWNDPMAVEAWRHINRLCHKHGMQCWVGPDPRFVSHDVTLDGSGLELLLFGDSAKAGVFPNIAEVRDGRFNIRCTLSPRHVHTLTDVAIQFLPIGLARVYAIRTGTTRYNNSDIVDITIDTQHFYNARDGYVEAFGRVPKRIGDDWSVISFFHVRTNHFDFSNPRHLRKYDRFLARLKNEGCKPDGIMWDEPGYTCQYGSLPFSPSIRSSYQANRKSPLELWKLALEAEDSSHIPARLAYYRSVQNSITRAELNLRKTARRLWGPATVLGIHDTWHFESADMCDMNHGSLNLWETARVKSGGFVDLGAVNKLQDSNSPWYSNLAAMSVIAASLGKSAKSPLAYNNLWTVGDDDQQIKVMEHCAKVMALFGTHWLAHAYGPAGTIGQERTFLGTPELPGYPKHSTWPAFPAWNTFLSNELNKVGQLPEANLLVLYPMETLYALADTRADNVAAEIFTLLLTLLDNHLHIDVLATTDLRKGRWVGKQLRVGQGKYDFVLCPHASIIDRNVLRTLSAVKEKVLYLFGAPERFADGKPLTASQKIASGGPGEILSRIKVLPELRPVEGPEQTWLTITQASGGTIVSLIPSRAGHRYKGNVRLKNRSIVIPETDQLKRILFSSTGEPVIL